MVIATKLNLIQYNTGEYTNAHSQYIHIITLHHSHTHTHIVARGAKQRLKQRRYVDALNVGIYSLRSFLMDYANDLLEHVADGGKPEKVEQLFDLIQGLYTSPKTKWDA
jgi:hypothetical protein